MGDLWRRLLPVQRIGQLGRRTAVLAATTTLAIGLVACGSEGSKDESAGEIAAGSDGSTDAALVKEAKRIIDAGTQAALYYNGNEKTVDPSAAESVEPGEWKGPTSGPAPQKGKTVKVISCVAGSACEDIALGAVEAGEKLGWNMELVNADATPAGYNKVLSSALTQKPDGLITVAISAGQVADKVAQANKMGIKSVGVATIHEEGSEDNWGVNQSFLETFAAQLEAYRAIADSEGTAKVVLMWDVSQPHLVESISATKGVLEQCGGCEILQTYEADTATFADPAALQQVVGSMIQRHGEDLEYILTPFGLGAQVILEAARAAGRDDIKVLTKNAEVANVGSVAKEGLFGDAGTDTMWTGYAAVDQLNRLFNDEEPLNSWEEGLQAKVFDSSNAPANGKFDWSEVVDFRAEYGKVWGLD